MKKPIAGNVKVYFNDKFLKPKKVKVTLPIKPDKYLLLPSDPKYREKSNRGKRIKYLTISKRGSIIKRVKKLIRKDIKMASNKTNKSKKADVVKSVAWLVEATFRGFVGWILLSNFDHLLTTAVAFYALGTGAVIVVSHFVRAHR